MDFQVGDIIAIRQLGWLADNICEATHSEVSHVGLIIGVNPIIVIEALLRTKTNLLDITLTDAQKAWCIRYSNLNEKDKNQLVKSALKFSADDYGWPDLILQLGDATFKTRWFTHTIGKAFLNHFPICSFIVGEAYDSIGINFSVTDWSVTPGDIMNYAIKNIERFTVRRIL